MWLYVQYKAQNTPKIYLDVWALTIKKKNNAYKLYKAWCAIEKNELMHSIYMRTDASYKKNMEPMSDNYVRTSAFCFICAFGHVN